MSKSDKPLNSFQVLTRLAAKYPAPEYACFSEVSNATGANSRRRADCLIMGLWPSRGLYLSGFEIKCSRADWLTELKNPEKADAIAKYCDYWYLVLGDPYILRDDELPRTWGLIIPCGSGLKIQKEAVRNDTPQPFSRGFLASIMRSTYETGTVQKQINAAVDKAKTDAYTRGRTDGERHANYNYPHIQKQLEELKQSVKDFADESGIDISTDYSWKKDKAKELGKAVKFVLDMGLESQARSFEFIENTATRILKEIEFYKELTSPNYDDILEKQIIEEFGNPSGEK